MTDEENTIEWYLSDKHDFAEGLDTSEPRNQTGTVFLKSIVPRPKTFGFLSKSIQPGPYEGKKLRMTAWVKTNLPDGASAQLWLRVDGDWKERTECFDNMYESRIKGITENRHIFRGMGADATLLSRNGCWLTRSNCGLPL